MEAYLKLIRSIPAYAREDAAHLEGVENLPWRCAHGRMTHDQRRFYRGYQQAVQAVCHEIIDEKEVDGKMTEIKRFSCLLEVVKACNALQGGKTTEYVGCKMETWESKFYWRNSKKFLNLPSGESVWKTMAA